MLSLAQRILDCPVRAGAPAVFWLGQAGFLIKTAAGRSIVIDPYLSDCCERICGFRRLMPRLVEPEELPLDLLLISHAHPDHFDPDSMPGLLADARVRLLAASDCREECERLGLPAGQIRYLTVGDRVNAEDVTVEALPCDHGELAPLALGFLITVDGRRIYFTGDTAYRPDLFADPRLQGVDLLIAPINGAFGNMNERQAAEAADRMKPKRIVPCHFWNFAEHGGDPGLFARCMQESAPAVAFTLLPMGGFLTVD